MDIILLYLSLNPFREIHICMLEMSNGPCRASPTSCHAVPCHRSSGRYGLSCPAGRASMGFVPGLRPKARPVGRFSCRAGPSSTPCRAGPRHIKPTTTHFHQYFHQTLKYFIIFISYLSFLPI